MFSGGTFEPKKVGRRGGYSPLGENQLSGEAGMSVLLEVSISCCGDCVGPNWEESVGNCPNTRCWHQAPTKGGDTSLMAGRTNTLDAGVSVRYP